MAVEKWKTKSWYQVYAPELFENKMIGEIVSSESKNLINRVIKIGLDEITGDLTKSYSSIKLRIFDVRGKKAYTKFIGHELSPTYIKSLIRKGGTIIDNIFKVKTSDGKEITVKYIILTRGKVPAKRRADIRDKIKTEIGKKASELTRDKFLQEILFKKLVVKMVPIIKKITPIRRIEIKKTEINEKE